MQKFRKILLSGPSITFLVVIVVLMINDFLEVEYDTVLPQWDLQELKGMLLPTADSIPPLFKEDDTYYGFGSNEGCFGGGVMNTKRPEAHYCYRFVNSDETIEFRGFVDGPDIKYDFKKVKTEPYLSDLRSRNINYVVEDFIYNNIRGSVVSYVDQTNVHANYKRSQLFWDDSGKYLSIMWKSPLNIERTSQDVANLLHTMRRFGDNGFATLSEDINPPYFVQ